MKRILLSALLLGVSGVFIGCDEDKTTKTDKSTVSGPGGSVTVTKKEEVKESGDMKGKTDKPEMKPETKP